MEKLNRLGWAEGLALSAFGVRVGVRVNALGVLPRVLLRLPPGWKASRKAVVERLYSLMVKKKGWERPGLVHLHVLYGDSVPVARGTTLDQVLDAFEADLQLYTAASSSDMTFLHAGVVGWQGRAIVIPGRSFSGKTTLVREMLRLGATYYSDEFAVVDNSGRVHPFARPLGIREDGSASQTKYAAEKLGATAGVEPLRASTVVISEYDAGARWQPTQLSQARGALELLANSIAVRSQPHQTLPRISELAMHAVFVKGTRGEARDAAAAILHLSSERRQLEVA